MGQLIKLFNELLILFRGYFLLSEVDKEWVDIELCFFRPINLDTHPTKAAHYRRY